MVKARALVVLLSKGQIAVTMARNMRLINRSLRVFSTRNELCIPLVRPIDKSESSRLADTLGQIRVEEQEFGERSQRPRTLREAVKGSLPPELLAIVPKSFDVIGQIAIIELPGQLVPFEELIGAGVLEICSNVRTVMAKAGAFSSDYRTRELRLGHLVASAVSTFPFLCPHAERQTPLASKDPCPTSFDLDKIFNQTRRHRHCGRFDGRMR